MGLGSTWSPSWSSRVFVEQTACVCSAVSDSLRPHDCSPQSPLSMGFSRKEYWSGLPFPPPGDLPDPGIEPTSPASRRQILYHCTTLPSPYFLKLGSFPQKK